MITIPIWAALAAPFVCFLLGVLTMACFAMAGSADGRIAQREGGNE